MSITMDEDINRWTAPRKSSADSGNHPGQNHRRQNLLSLKLPRDAMALQCAKAQHRHRGITPYQKLAMVA